MAKTNPNTPTEQSTLSKILSGEPTPTRGTDEKENR